AYAERTKVPVDRSRAEIEQTLKRYGATSFAYFSEATRAIVVFEANGRRIRFDLPLPDGDNNKTGQVVRQRWRALLLCIKAKLESVESNIETFEEAFLAHVVMPDGVTVGQHTAERIANAYAGEAMTPLLPAPTGGET
ncbi:MAG: hypothetical protein GY788_05065, partial [bacterium]|nr:hypothetical protein [bacterium]